MPDRSAGAVRVIDSAVEGRELPIIEGPGSARAVVGPHSGARFRSFQRIDLGPGGATIPLSHASDSVYYVIAGTGAIVDLASGEEHPLSEGTMVHIDAGDRYRFTSASGDLKLLGGPCPAAPDVSAG